jgi:hypothetical protein
MISLARKRSTSIAVSSQALQQFSNYDLGNHLTVRSTEGEKLDQSCEGAYGPS